MLSAFEKIIKTLILPKYPSVMKFDIMEIKQQDIGGCSCFLVAFFINCNDLKNFNNYYKINGLRELVYTCYSMLGFDESYGQSPTIYIMDKTGWSSYL